MPMPVHQVLSLPTGLQPDTMYLVLDGDYCQMYVTSNLGEPKRVAPPSIDILSDDPLPVRATGSMHYNVTTRKLMISSGSGYYEADQDLKTNDW